MLLGSLPCVRTGARRPAEYAKTLKERGFKRVVNVDLEDSRFDSVFSYAVAVGPDRPVQDAIRELLLQALAAEAVNPAIRAGRLAAYADARDRVITATREFLRELARDLELEPAAGETSGIQPGNFIAVDAMEPF
jgi:hypothetical protein